MGLMHPRLMQPRTAGLSEPAQGVELGVALQARRRKHCGELAMGVAPPRRIVVHPVTLDDGLPAFLASLRMSCLPAGACRDLDRQATLARLRRQGAPYRGRGRPSRSRPEQGGHGEALNPYDKERGTNAGEEAQDETDVPGEGKPHRGRRAGRSAAGRWGALCTDHRPGVAHGHRGVRQRE